VTADTTSGESQASLLVLLKKEPFSEVVWTKQACSSKNLEKWLVFVASYVRISAATYKNTPT